MFGGCVILDEPCDACSTDRQWQCAGAELAAGDAAARTAAVGEGPLDMGLGEEDPDSTRWGRGDGRAAGTEDVGGPPCRRVALAVVEVGGRSPSGLTSNVSERSAAYGSQAREHAWSGGRTCAGGGYAPLAGCCEVGGCQWVGSWP
jgi:hypothetical protein